MVRLGKLKLVTNYGEWVFFVPPLLHWYGGLEDTASQDVGELWWIIRMLDLPAAGVYRMDGQRWQIRRTADLDQRRGTTANGSENRHDN